MAYKTDFTAVFMIHHNKGTLSWNDMQKLNLITMHLFEFFVEENIKSVSLDIYSVTKLFVNRVTALVWLPQYELNPLSGFHL